MVTKLMLPAFASSPGLYPIAVAADVFILFVAVFIVLHLIWFLGHFFHALADYYTLRAAYYPREKNLLPEKNSHPNSNVHSR